LLNIVPDVGRVMLVVPVVVNVMALAPEVVRLPPRVIVLLPLLTPVPPLALGRTPVTSAVKETADHDGLPAAFPWRIVVVVPWLAKSAEARVGLLNEGAAEEPVKFPKNVCEAALESVNVNAGVLVAVATDVVNSGLNVPAENVVTVPEEAGDAQLGTPPLIVKIWLADPAPNLEYVPAPVPYSRSPFVVKVALRTANGSVSVVRNAVLLNALLPSVPPAPTFKVEPSVPARVRLLLTIKVLPAAIFKVFVPLAVIVKPLTDVGVMSPNPIVNAGVVVAVAHVAVTPLLAAAVDTEVTVPEEAVDQVGIPPAETVRTWPVVPIGKTVAAPPTPPYIVSPVVVIGLPNRAPEVGNVILVEPVVFKVMFPPVVVKFPPRVIVLLPLLTPVPPLALGRTPVTSAVKLTADHDGSPDAFP
jgi:hypothetical protein